MSNRKVLVLNSSGYVYQFISIYNSTGFSDKDKIISLNNNGQIDSSMLTDIIYMYKNTYDTAITILLIK